MLESCENILHENFAKSRYPNRAVNLQITKIILLEIFLKEHKANYHCLICMYMRMLVSRPTLISHPPSQYINLTQTATFTCSATGYNVNYKWRIGSGSFSDKVTGINSNTLVIPDVKSSDTNTYTCVASNQGGSVSSNTARLMVTGMYIYILIFNYRYMNSVLAKNVNIRHSGQGIAIYVCNVK